MEASGVEEPVVDLPVFPVNSSSEWVGGGPSALLTKTELRANAFSSTESLLQVPGLLIQESFGGIDPPRLSVRGSGIQSAPVSRGLALSYDGFPLNLADGSFYWAMLETSWLRSAQLHAGTTGGVPALGGALSFVSQSATFVVPGETSVEVGSHDRIRLSLRQHFRFDGGALSVAAAILESGGWRDYSAQRRQSIQVDYRHPLTPNGHEFTLRIYASRPRFEVPGPLSMEAVKQNPVSNISRVIQDQPRRKSDYFQIVSGFRLAGATGYWDFKLGVTQWDDEFRQLLPNGISIQSGKDIAFVGNVRKEWDVTLPQFTHFRFQLQAGRYQAIRFRNENGARGPMMGDNDLLPVSGNVAIDHYIEFGDLFRLELGVSIFHARRKLGENLAGRNSTALNLSNTEWAPRLGWVWKARDTLQMNLSWSRGYEPPTFDDLLFTAGPIQQRNLQSRPLAWQKAESWEAGIRGEPGRIVWAVSAYVSQWKNEFLRLADENGASRGTVNAERTRHYGVESSLQYLLLQKGGVSVHWWGNYYRTWASFDGDPVYEDRRLGGVPPHQGASGVRAEFARGWFVAPGLEWRSGRTYVDHANTFDYGGMVHWSLVAGIQNFHGWAFEIGIKNILDKKQIANTAGVLDQAPMGADTVIFLPASPRQIQTLVRYAW